MPIYTYACPVCNVERTGLFRLSDPPPHCNNSDAHGAQQEPPEMVKQLAAPGFQVRGEGAYTNRAF